MESVPNWDVGDMVGMGEVVGAGVGEGVAATVGSGVAVGWSVGAGVALVPNEYLMDKKGDLPKAGLA
jgi:hypothetical protein